MKTVVLPLLAALAFAVPAAAQNHAHHAAGHEAAAAIEAVGVVKAVDAKSGAVTVAHDPVPALGWPAMTMSFKVASGVVLSGVKVGDRVKFRLRGQQITAIRKL